MRPIVRTFLSLTVAATVAALPTAASATPGDGNGRSAEAHAANQERRVGDVATEDNDSNDGGTPNNVADSGDNAHPSGKDRSVEHGGSGNQGKAKSDPDDDGRGPDRTNGGVDQPDRAGGVDKADQDGNNGCGNDDDFEDDSEGWCGRNPKRGGPDRDADRPTPPPATDRPARGGGQSGSPSAPATGSQGGTAVTTVEASCPATSVQVTSTKDLSNVVLVFADGDHQKFDGLSGRSGSFSGTGANAGDVIVRVYVKSGANASGDGPGYGARHDVACNTTSSGDPNGNGNGNGNGKGNGGVPVVARDGERPGPGRIPSVDLDADVDAGESDRPAGQGTQSRGDDEDSTEVLGVVLERPTAPAGVAAAGLDVAPAAAADVAGEALARTGADTGRAALVAAFALALGGLAVRRTRSA